MTEAHIVHVNPRSFTGSFQQFCARYGDHSDMLDKTPECEDQRHVWTVVEGVTGDLYVVPGYHRVNRIGYVVTERRWSNIEEMNPGYKW